MYWCEGGKPSRVPPHIAPWVSVMPYMWAPPWLQTFLLRRLPMRLPRADDVLTCSSGHFICVRSARSRPAKWDIEHLVWSDLFEHRWCSSISNISLHRPSTRLPRGNDLLSMLWWTFHLCKSSSVDCCEVRYRTCNACTTHGSPEVEDAFLLLTSSTPCQATCKMVCFPKIWRCWPRNSSVVPNQAAMSLFGRASRRVSTTRRKIEFLEEKKTSKKAVRPQW